MTRYDLAPSLFVVMPFGQKKDPSQRFQIDFDDIYGRAIKPAAEDLGLDVVRADEERVGGFIHLPMFERLLLSDIVLADLTLASPNVFYELGIRHAARPRTTVLTFARVGSLPFDVAPMRAIPYTLQTSGELGDGDSDRLRTRLVEHLGATLQDRVTTDSPLFQLISSYPGVDLPHDVTETFQDRARRLTDLSNEVERLGRSGPDALPELLRIEGELLAQAGVPAALLVDLMLAYRDIKAYDAMIDLVDRSPHEVARNRTVREQQALAINRRGGPGDSERAEAMVKEILTEVGPSPETLGILGRVHKDRYLALRREGSPLAQVALEEAIETYRSGFQADPRDYYPGINAATLMYLEGSKQSLKDVREILGAVAFAVARRGALDSTDYWDVATVLEAALLRGDRVLAMKAAQKAAYRAPPPWKVETTLQNLRLVEEALSRGGERPPWFDHVIAPLRGALPDD